MKKSNNTRITKKLVNSPNEPGATLHLNKSVPTFVDFLDLSALPTRVVEIPKDQRDLISSLDQNLKPRTHMKAPSKRLALLLDAYADPHTKKHHHTIDGLDASSRETSLRSPLNGNEGQKKPLPLKNFGLANSFKTLDFLKSKEFSKLALAKVLGKSTQKSSKHGREEKEHKDTQDSMGILYTQPNEELERCLSKDIPKRMSKTPYKDEKKSGNGRTAHSKSKSKLRKTKVLYTDSSIQEKTLVLNSSQPQSTKHRVNICSASMNFNNSSTISILPKTTSNHQERYKNERVVQAQVTRFPTAGPRHMDTSSSVNYGDYYSAVGVSNNDKDKEKHKKNYSSLIAANTCGSLGSVNNHTETVKELSHDSHDKILSIRNRKTETVEKEKEKEGSQTRGEPLPVRVSYSRPPLFGQVLDKHDKHQVSIQESLPTWSTSRNPEMLSDHRLARLVSEKGKGQEGISVVKLEKAFDMFLEDNKHKLVNGKASQVDLEKIIKAWGAFMDSVGVSEEIKQNLHYLPSNKKMSSEREMKTLKKEDTPSLGLGLNKKNGLSISTNQSALPTEKKILKRDTTAIEKCDTEKAAVPMEGLQQALEKQQSTIAALQRKEAKLLKLLKAIGKKGMDVEKIYREEVKKNSISFLDLFEDTEFSKEESKVDETIVSLPRGESMLDDESVEIFSPNGPELKVHKSCSDAKSTTDSTPFPTVGGQARLNLGLKGVPRLDLTGLNSNSSKMNSGGVGSGNGSKGFKLNLKGITGGESGNNNEERPGFHEEFMSRIDEFSLSWRQEALNQRNLEDEE